MRRQIQASLLATALLVGTAAAAFAEVSDADRKFIEQVAMGGHEEVSICETAAKNDNSAVAAFGRQMVSDHTKTNDELATIAKCLGVTPPARPSLTQQAKGAATSILPGATFDRTYVDQQLSGHKKALRLLQNQVSNGDNPLLKAFAESISRSLSSIIAELEKLEQQVAQK